LQLNAASSQYCRPLQTLEMTRVELEKQRDELQKNLDLQLAVPPNRKDHEEIKRLRKAINDVEKEIKTCYGRP
jgi:hypothetical protein